MNSLLILVSLSTIPLVKVRLKSKESYQYFLWPQGLMLYS